MKGGGSVIFSIVLRVFLLPNSSRSSQNNVGPTDRNSLPCHYQSLQPLTIILICLSLLFSLPKPQRLLPTLRQQGFTVIVADSRTCRFICAGAAMSPARLGPRDDTYHILHSDGGRIEIPEMSKNTNTTNYQLQINVLHPQFC